MAAQGASHTSAASCVHTAARQQAVAAVQAQRARARLRYVVKLPLALCVQHAVRLQRALARLPLPAQRARGRHARVARLRGEAMRSARGCSSPAALRRKCGGAHDRKRNTAQLRARERRSDAQGEGGRTGGTTFAPPSTLPSARSAVSRPCCISRIGAVQAPLHAADAMRSAARCAGYATLPHACNSSRLCAAATRSARAARGSGGQGSRHAEARGKAGGMLCGTL
jgi:hypothetical protein